MSSIENLDQVNRFLGDLINRKKIVFKDDIKLEKVFYFAELLGNPQKNLKIIHIAGTSGKGSTSFILSKILEIQGFKVGLTTSPHLNDVRERMQINNSILDEKSFVKYFNSILPTIQKVEKSDFGDPTYFEVLTLLALKIFEKEKVDYAILEVGMGGRLDATNICNNEDKTCLINNIGMDHSKSLGNSLEKIASEKAGIIYPKNQVFKTFQSIKINQVFRKKCLEVGANLDFVKLPKNFELKTSLVGDFQKLNLTLGLKCLDYLSSRDGFEIDKKNLQKTLLNLSFPGRFEVFNLKNSDKKIIFDGAHNFQKVSKFLSSLKKLYPNQNFDFIVGLKKGKNYRGFLKKILNFEGTQKIYLIEIDKTKNPGVESVPILEMENYLKNLKKEVEKNSKKVEIVPSNNLKNTLKNTSQNDFVIVGSLYFYNSLIDSKLVETLKK